MTRLDEAALLSQWEEKQRRAAHAPHGLKRKRERENYDFAHRLLRQDVSARRKGRKRAA